MPRIVLNDANAMRWEIDTRQVETVLRAWFDEVLPWAYTDFHGERYWPHVNVSPMWAWKYGAPSDPDWLCDSRVLGRFEEFRATDGETGLAELARLRAEYERELRTVRRSA